ncbi:MULTISPECIES: hypothetical protein [Vibrio]|nr:MULTISPECIES: hypothetical protein [Vibrio harveyi group]EGQ9976007.1 hypothetical protein [Vibrio vulnificus]EGQ7830822.1 hypothetical protein [Vibrio parahaemolyticus]EHZ2756103.1 hypothetical protein [Vibrio vulnificus]EJB0375945.1 hypothetical protein [Vibrio parahaemolyticus]EJE8686201.1 hypothetical protein [Vibrio vulnificus]
MKLINIAEGGKIGDLKLNNNIVVTDDMSQVVFVDIGKNGEVLNLDADGNQVMTPEAYSAYLDSRVKELQIPLKEVTDELEGISNDIDKAKIKRQLKVVRDTLNSVTTSDGGKFNYLRAVSQLTDICKNLGYGVLAGIITTKLGF